MEVSGYDIMDRLEIVREKANSYKSRFDKSILQFPEKVVDLPTDMMDNFVRMKEIESSLSELQCRYNLKVTAVFDGKTRNLQEVIKLYSMYGEITNLWSSAESQEATSWGRGAFFGAGVMDKEKVYPERQISAILCRDGYDESKKIQRELKQLIRKMNRTLIEVEDSYMELF